MNKSLNRLNKALIILFQVVVLTVTYYTCFLLRFDFSVPESMRNVFFATLVVVLVVKLPVFHFLHLSRGWWRYSGMSDLLDILKAALLSSALISLTIYAFTRFYGFPRSVLVLDALLTILAIGGARFGVRAYTEYVQAHPSGTGTLIVGAGHAGSSIARELKHPSNVDYNLVGFVDDDPSKRNVKVQGVKVLGTTDELPKLVSKYQIGHVLIALPSATGEEMQRIISKCHESRVDFKTLPAMKDVINGSVSVRQVRSVRVEDLLNRQPVQMDCLKIRDKLKGKVVMVTGAGGSIGSELVRQVARFYPEKLVLFDRSENNLHRLDLELAGYGWPLDYALIVGDILDVVRLRQAVSDYHPSSIFHAAAYKHVPMMEKNCFQAVNNNIFGTYNVALVARQSGVEDFVMISSDKAVNPTNVMGVTKRVAELLILGLQDQSTRYVSVRFGNVLGSNGSVIPIFEQQIAQRRPITVTHPDAKRYFMTIPEAVELVLQASTMGKGGEIFVLDMGEPVKIVDLARNLIQLSGLDPDKDIPIVYTGLRPGEKLFEELKLDGEGIKPTENDKIRVLEGGRVSLEQVRQWLGELGTFVDSRNVHGLVTKLKEIVPEYTPSKEILAMCEVDRFDQFVGYKRQRVAMTKEMDKV